MKESQHLGRHCPVLGRVITESTDRPCLVVVLETVSNISTSLALDGGKLKSDALQAVPASETVHVVLEPVKDLFPVSDVERPSLHRRRQVTCTNLI